MQSPCGYIVSAGGTDLSRLVIRGAKDAHFSRSVRGAKYTHF